MSGCVRCKAPGTVVVQEFSGGTVNTSGPITARSYACVRHAAEITAEESRRERERRRRRRPPAKGRAR